VGGVEAGGRVPIPMACSFWRQSTQGLSTGRPGEVARRPRAVALLVVVAVNHALAILSPGNRTPRPYFLVSAGFVFPVVIF